MGLFDRLFGDEQQPQQQPPRAPRSQDDIEIERYRYLLRTAPPEKIEEVHAEAFAKLTPEQRRRVYEELKNNSGETPASDQPQDLAQAATRSELRQPGTLERSFAGPSFGSMLGASMLGTVAGFVVGSAIMSMFLPPLGADLGADGASGDQGAGDQGAGDQAGDAGSDAGADAGADGGGWGDFGGGDFGGGDFGGDFGF